MREITVIWLGPAVDLSRESWLRGCQIRYRAFGHWSPRRDETEPAGLVLASVIGAADQTAVEVVQQCARSLARHSILVAVTGPRGATVPLLAAGAHDVVSVGDPEEMRYRLQRWKRLAEQRSLCIKWARHALDLGKQLTRSVREAEALRLAAQADALTGLANRRRFHADLRYAVSYAERHAGRVGLIVADVDGLSAINDGLGRPAGDSALRQIARLFVARVRRVDLVARIGEDEFTVILPTTQLQPAVLVAERLRSEVELLHLSTIPSLTMSLGVAAWGGAPDASGEAVVARARQALDGAKQCGKNRVVAVDENCDRAA